MTSNNFTPGPLPLLVSARVRLTPDQRQELKAAYRAKTNELVPTTAAGRGGLQVSTSYGGSNAINQALGMSSLVFADLANSRDTISMALILKIQAVLGVSIVTHKQLMDACKSYCDYVFTKAEEEASK